MDWILLAQAQDAVIISSEELTGLDALLASLWTPQGHVAGCGVLLLVGLFLLLPPRGRGGQFLLGSVLSAAAVLLFLIPSVGKLPVAPVFLLLEGLAVLGGVGTVTSRSPVYCAIWFASSLLAIGAVLLMAGAQFLGLATVAVYAGAIVVTFLFVLMLAQPEGHSVYDRIGWGTVPTFFATLAGVSLIGIVGVGLCSPSSHPESSQRDRLQRLDSIASAPVGDRLPSVERDVLSADHVARLGGDLFGGHLIEVQVAAVLLLVGLVGAIAMAIHGKDLPANSVGREASNG